MNSPIVIAAIASLITIIVYSIASGLSNKWIKVTVQILSVLVGISLTGVLSDDTATSAKSGEYFFYIVIAIVIISKIFGRK